VGSPKDIIAPLPVADHGSELPVPAISLRFFSGHCLQFWGRRLSTAIPIVSWPSEISSFIFFFFACRTGCVQ
jgi:hypothetical protein